LAAALGGGRVLPLAVEGLALLAGLPLAPLPLRVGEALATPLLLGAARGRIRVLAAALGGGRVLPLAVEGLALLAGLGALLLGLALGALGFPAARLLQLGLAARLVKLGLAELGLAARLLQLGLADFVRPINHDLSHS
jgi:hypothetical protein